MTFPHFPTLKVTLWLRIVIVAIVAIFGISCIVFGVPQAGPQFFVLGGLAFVAVLAYFKTWYFTIKSGRRYAKAQDASIMQMIVTGMGRNTSASTNMFGSGWYCIVGNQLKILTRPFISASDPELEMEFPIGSVNDVQIVEIYRGWAVPRLEIDYDGGSVTFELMPPSGSQLRGASRRELEQARGHLLRLIQGENGAA